MWSEFLNSFVSIFRISRAVYITILCTARENTTKEAGIESFS